MYINDFQTLDKKQCRKITLKRRERNKVGPTISLADFLERVSKPESSEREPKEPHGPTDLKKWSGPPWEGQVA